ncbi:histone-lysine N-methyltransferase SETMAR [Trichonephila clavipes]|uniref:Histone-lysine N-methyltransferase SETMAR n=1 Tax=Trichonephila clavipes TaxID=2585209 RepID=A0A8X7BCT9_TRICX|nr:histone-lysine N-methyltransferase SETMAR [Trichonephila clavipes]
MGVNKEKMWFFLQFFFDKGENASHVAEIENGVYGANNVTDNYVQFWFRRFCSGIFDVKDAPQTGRPFVENVDKITKVIEVDRLMPNSTTAIEFWAFPPRIAADNHRSPVSSLEISSTSLCTLSGIGLCPRVHE